MESSFKSTSQVESSFEDNPVKPAHLYLEGSYAHC